MKTLGTFIVLLAVAMPLWADTTPPTSAPFTPSDYCYKMLGTDQEKCNECMEMPDPNKKEECLNNVMSDLNTGVGNEYHE